MSETKIEQVRIAADSNGQTCKMSVEKDNTHREYFGDSLCKFLHGMRINTVPMGLNLAMSTEDTVCDADVRAGEITSQTSLLVLNTHDTSLDPRFTQNSGRKTVSRGDRRRRWGSPACVEQKECDGGGDRRGIGGDGRYGVDTTAAREAPFEVVYGIETGAGHYAGCTRKQTRRVVGFGGSGQLVDIFYW
ncbi:hypothetical protein C8R44DRAFT_746689 [Mycena epipterygia]|nr:hypothetical protein C8R44DRAFT_746689 [Mycena epipterygia]